jgi:hypothetical protein
METEKILQLVRAYLSLNNQMPPMVLSFNNQSEPLALIGSFRNFQEQVTFCAISRMAFILNQTKNYHILTHGFMREDLTKDDLTQKKITNQLIKFLGKNKSKKEVGDAEVLIDTFISPEKNTCSVYKLIRTDRGDFKEFQPILEFNTDDTIQGMFTQLIPNKNETVPMNLKAEIESLINRISYEFPKIEVKGNTQGLGKLWAKKK